jgi:hypothetical protein
LISTSETKLSRRRERDKPRQGVVASTLNSFRNGAVRFIVWLDSVTLELKRNWRQEHHSKQNALNKRREIHHAKRTSANKSDTQRIEGES